MILVNGADCPVVSAMDRGLAYGDGVFRTLAARDGAPQQWRRHYAKLAHDCAALGIACPDETLLAREVLSLCQEHSGRAVKIIITRGPGDRGYRCADQSEPTRIVMSTPLAAHPDPYREAGVKVRFCALELAPQPALAGIKHLNRLENVLARSEWNDPDIAEGILCDAEGNVIGGTMTNLFIAQGDTLATPELSRCGVAGITRDRVIDAAARHRVECRVRQVPKALLLGADEIFLVNSLIGVWPVRELDGWGRPPGPLARKVQRWLEQDSDAN